jgi:hypothetical protein
MLPCKECGSPGIFKRQGQLSWWMVVPKRIAACSLRKNPQRRCGGSISSMCRSGICPTKEEAARQWNFGNEGDGDAR